MRNGGPVIAPEQVDGLFEPFRRLGLDRVGSTRGVGLGLSIVRAVASAHGGTVGAEPGGSGGLVVRVLLPAGHPAQQPVQDPAVVGRQDGGGRHLGAEDAVVVRLP